MYSMDNYLWDRARDLMLSVFSSTPFTRLQNCLRMPRTNSCTLLLFTHYTRTSCLCVHIFVTIGSHAKQCRARTHTFKLSFFLINPPILESEMPSCIKPNMANLAQTRVVVDVDISVSNTLPVNSFFTNFFFKNFLREESRSPATRDVAAASACVGITIRPQCQIRINRLSTPTNRARLTALVSLNWWKCFNLTLR